MNYKVNEDFTEQLSRDFGKKYLSSGIKLGGDINGDKIKLYTEDDHGKHSNFAQRIFFATLSGNTLSGKFSLSRYVIVLLIILAAFCVESIVMAVISASVLSVIFPAAILIIEILYLIFIKKISYENDTLIKKYLEDCAVED